MSIFKKYLIIFLLSMVPLVELRGGVPAGLTMGLDPLPVFIICVIANMLPVPIIFFFARKVLEWGADKPVIGKMFTFFLEKGKKGGEKLQAKAGRGLFIALLLFVVLSSLDIPNSWLAFIYGIPACGVVLLSLRSAWKDFRWNQVLISIIMWGGILSLYLSFFVFWQLNIWKLFLLGIPGQAAVILWFRMYRKGCKEEQNG